MTQDPRTFRIIHDPIKYGFYLEDDYGENQSVGFYFHTLVGAKNHQNYLVKEFLDNYEPRETGDAWTGGFAKNH